MACLLLVEDEADIRTVLAEVLEEAGHEVVEAESGGPAALLLDRAAGFDMLVTDINMPGLLDGIGLAARFRKRHAVRPIFYVTGRPDALRQVAMQPNREAVLLKPYGLLSLVAIVRTTLAAAALYAERRAYPDQVLSLHGSRMVLTAA
ncbi:MAG TPA: response regulator [Acetobacteraceae bacterium]